MRMNRTLEKRLWAKTEDGCTRAFLLAPVCLSLLVCGGCCEETARGALRESALAHPVIPAPTGQDGIGELRTWVGNVADACAIGGGTESARKAQSGGALAAQPVGGKTK